MSMNEEELIKARPLLFESRPFTRLTKRNATLQQGGPLMVPASTHHAEIDLDFQYFTSAITRIQLLLNTNSREVSRYAAEKSSIERTAEEARATLVSLRELLTDSLREKQNRLEYDKIATDILSIPRLNPRDEQYANLDRLNTEIRELERERDEYRHVWAARRHQFEEIVKQLEVMSAQIKEDKDEQDRREGMSEEEEEGEEFEGGSATNKSGGATPADGGRLGVPLAGQMQTASGPATPNVGSGATPQPMIDEKEEGEEDDDVDLVDAPPLRRDVGKRLEVSERMDMM